MGLNIIQEVLLEIYSKRGDNWNIDTETGRFLVDTINAYNRMNILEIGTSSGFSAIYMAAHTQALITSIESHITRHKEALFYVDKVGFANRINLIRDHAPLCFSRPEFSKGPFDFVFLDCIKKYYGPCMEALYPKFLSSDVIIVADNMNSHKEAAKNLIDWFDENKDVFDYEVLGLGSGVLIAKRIVKKP